jgi:hypothetical protein
MKTLVISSVFMAAGFALLPGMSAQAGGNLIGYYTFSNGNLNDSL